MHNGDGSADGRATPAELETLIHRNRAAIETLEKFATNVRVLRRAVHAPAAVVRLREMSRLNTETIEILRRNLAAAETELRRAQEARRRRSSTDGA